MPTPRVVVLDYGFGNVRSAERALARAGAEVEITRDFDRAMNADGLLVPVLRNCGERDPQELKQALDKLIADARARKVPPEELRANTITLSNYGSIAGRYASPVVLPPTVAILGAGRITKQVVVVDDRPAVHRMLPLSLTFDHRVVTGGEAGRFLNSVIADLQQPAAADGAPELVGLRAVLEPGHRPDAVRTPLGADGGPSGPDVNSATAWPMATSQLSAVASMASSRSRHRWVCSHAL